MADAVTDPPEAPTTQRGGRGLRVRTQREAPTRRSAWLEADAARDEEIGWHAFAKSGVGAAGGGDSGALHCGFDGCAGAVFKPPVDANWPESVRAVLDGCIGAAFTPAVDADRLESVCAVGGGGALLCGLGSCTFARRRRSLNEEWKQAVQELERGSRSSFGDFHSWRGSWSLFESYDEEDKDNDAQPHDIFEDRASGEDNDALPHDSFEGRASGQRLYSIDFGDNATMAVAALPQVGREYTLTSFDNATTRRCKEISKKVVVPPPELSLVLRVVG